MEKYRVYVILIGDIVCHRFFCVRDCEKITLCIVFVQFPVERMRYRYVRCVFVGDKRYDAIAWTLADVVDDKAWGKQPFD